METGATVWWFPVYAMLLRASVMVRHLETASPEGHNSLTLLPR